MDGSKQIGISLIEAHSGLATESPCISETAYSLPCMTTSKSTPTVSGKQISLAQAGPFRFLDLPQALQAMIYHIHYPKLGLCFTILSHSAADFPNHKSNHKLNIADLPSLAIERACHQVCNDAKLVRENIWPRHLVVGSTVSNQDVLASLLDHDALYNWLLNRITSITFADFESKPVGKLRWRELVLQSPSLRHFNISNSAQEIDARVGSFTNTMIRADFTAGLCDEGHLKLISILDLRHLAKTLRYNRQEGGWSIQFSSKVGFWALATATVGGELNIAMCIVVWQFKATGPEIIERIFETERDRS